MLIVLKETRVNWLIITCLTGVKGKISTAVSSSVKLIQGAPQGSVFGPLLFLHLSKWFISSGWV